MSHDIFARSIAHYRERVAADLGCETTTFDSHALTVVDRPGHLPVRTLMLAVTFGTGTVVQVNSEFRRFVEGLRFEKHYLAFGVSEMIMPFLLEARARGFDVETRGPGLGFLPADEPPVPSIPPGLRLERWGAEQCAPLAPAFPNALWESDDDDLDEFRYGLVLLNESRVPLAMAGAWHESEGLVEIGVDVVRSARGSGLAPLVVGAMAHSIIEAGDVPTYYCAATNVRSHRTALRAGFVPIVSRASIRLKRESGGPAPASAH